MSHRPKQIAGIIRSAAASFAAKVTPNIAEAISIVEVKVSRDFSYADIFVSAIGDIRKALAFLDAHSKEIRAKIQSEVRLHRLPKLRFHRDEVGERASRIDDLLKKL